MPTNEERAQGMATNIFHRSLNGSPLTFGELRRMIEVALDAAEKRGFDRGRAQGCEDVAKYARAIGEIESVLGYAGARPLRETVQSVRALAAHIPAPERGEEGR